MLEKRKPRIGLLGIMHGIYDEAQPGITHHQDIKRNMHERSCPISMM
jgi:hypothetical protein